jgi:PASTA domain
MTGRVFISRTIEVPDLVGLRADHAVEELRERGLLPIIWSAEVEHVDEAGVVLALDPASGSAVSLRACITLSVATHAEFGGHADDSLTGPAGRLVAPTLTKPVLGDSSAASLPARLDDLAPLQERGIEQMRLW